MVTASLLSSESIPATPDTSYREAEGFVKSALNAMSAHIAILDEQGSILDVNAAWRQFADDNGFENSSYGIGMNYLAVCDQSATQDAQQVAQGIRNVLAGVVSEFYLEYPCHAPSERRWYVVRVSRFEWYGYQRLIVAHQNVTDLKKVQIELEESRTRIQAVLDNVIDGIITVTPGGMIESVNPAAATIFGYKARDLLGQHMSLLLDDERFEPDEKRSYVSSLTAHLRLVHHETQGRRRDGSVFPMYLAMNRMQMDRSISYTGIIQDITERKQLEAEQFEKERLSIALEKEREVRQLKDRFMSMMSHELRTPLASIQLASDMLKKYGDRATEEEKRESIDAIETQVTYLSEIVSDVMTISRNEFLGQEPARECLDLETYLRDIIEELEWTYRKTHRLVFSGTERRVEARVDRKLLRGAITNLLSNAIKYSPEGGEVRLELDCAEADTATIRVIDQGIGIPESDLPHLFEAFHRAENVDKIPGTGLGLAIARQAVDLHGGSIAVSSTVGQGTTFTISLPLHQEK